MPNPPKTLLIVEDEKPLARALELKLAHAGFETTTVSDGEAALKLLHKEPFDLVVLDLVMPKVNGFSVLEELKTKKMSVPVIVLSNLGQEEDKKKAKSLGAQEFFVKSDTPLVEIVDYVEQFLVARQRNS